MRLFVAAELPEALYEALCETSAALRDTVRGRYVAPDSFHVTLAFLGEVPSERVVTLVDVLDQACAGREPITARVGTLGSFGGKRGATLWQSVDGGDELADLAHAVRAGLEDAGFSFDQKGFRPHVTLMRDARLRGLELPMPVVASGLIDTVTLFKSDLSGPRPVYTALQRFVLGDD